MSLSVAAKKVNTRASGIKAFREKRPDAPTRAPANRVTCCPQCGQPILEVQAVLQRERRFIEQLLEENELFKQSLSEEIYEDFNQQLVGALLHFQSFERMQWENRDTAQEVFRMAVKLLRETLVEARRIADKLKPPVLDDFGIIEGIRYLLDETRKSSGTEVEFHKNGDFRQISPHTKTCVFRIVQELLAGVCLSGSEKVRLDITCNEKLLRLKIERREVAFEARDAAENSFSLRILRERVELLGGRMIHKSTPRKASRIVILLPAAKADPIIV